MVWCPIHCIYLHGKNSRINHVTVTGCNFINNYKPNRKPLEKYNKRNNGEYDDNHKTKYFWRRDRGHRSKFRTNLKKKGR